ncbi:MAG: hypothetical protein A2Y17_10265 [Clostridiales bacterium GWF2_38_85]|nr:MAG: hypothetical protein A2Y17_10265 [Clostridiales bacterium GWF2_38_85]HBL83290.1 hypothetical protein [Clostridiales bacterium]
MEKINKFINANGKIMKIEKINLLYKVYIIFLVLMLCLLPFVGGVIGIAGLTIVSLYCIAGCVYNYNIINKPSTFKKIFISYFIMIIYLFLVFNLFLYSIPKLMGLNLNLIILLIIVFEIICIIIGYYYTYLSIQNNKIKERKEATPLTISIIAFLSGSWTIFMRRFVSRTPITTQAFILIIISSICCCLYAFYLGKIFIPMLVYIKKYNINKFSFIDEKEHKR